MGIEYRLQFSAPGAEAVAAVLRRLPTARESPSASHRFEIGTDSTERDRSQATAQVQPGGLYFCDNCGGSGRALLGEVVARLVSAFGPVVVEEL
jgi:hypothetical protein